MITLNDVRGASNPLRSYNYEFIIPTIPVAGNTDVMRMLVTSASIPGFSVDTFESNHFGFTLKHTGKGDYPRTVAITYEENNDLTIYTTLRAWREILFNSILGTQIEAKTVGILKLLDLNRKTISQITFAGLFLQSVSDVPLRGDTSSAVSISATFSYDIHAMTP